MSNNNHNNPSCAFAEQMVSYLYGEADEREKFKFETHLANCPTCADELAAFGFVRSAVLDWRAEEFSKLPTPAFDIPVAESKESFLTTVVSSSNRSWLAGFRQMFSFNPLRATAAFGVLIVCAGIAWFAFNFSGGNEVVKNGDDGNLIQTAISPPVEILEKQKENRVAVKADEKTSPEITDSTLQIKRLRPDSPNKSIVRVSGNVPKNNADGFVRRPKETNANIKKPVYVQKKQIPNLYVAEEEDKTIRLADLFDEISAK